METYCRLIVVNLRYKLCIQNKKQVQLEGTYQDVLRPSNRLCRIISRDLYC
jgi:hypothetical protein